MRSLQLLAAIVLLTIGMVAQAKIDRVDKVHIIQTVLSDAEFTDWSGAKVADIYLLTVNLPKAFRPSASLPKITLINPNELSEKLKSNLDFRYFQVRRFSLEAAATWKSTSGIVW